MLRPWPSAIAYSLSTGGALRFFVALSSSMGKLPRNRGQPVYPVLPVYPQCTRRRRMPSDGREPYRASIYEETPDFTRVLADRRAGADEKEQGRKGPWCPGRESYAITDTTNRCLSLVWWRERSAWWRG